MFRHSFTPLAFAIAFAPIAAPAADAHVRLGPPWISIELPVNPLDPTTKGAFLVVRTYHHDKTMPMALEGRAEGIVNGERRSVPLTFDNTSADNAKAVRKTWPSEGAWVLVITGNPGPGSVTALVSIAEGGEVRQVRVPSRTVENGRWTVPVQVSSADVETALRALTSSTSLGAR